jgi:HPt (histidine-containing phosphotransfer) domain-containing protein
VPIIALTAHDANSYRDACMGADMDDLLTKPYTLEQLAQLLRRWIVPAPRQLAPERSDNAALSRIDAAAVVKLRRLGADGRIDLYSRLVDLFQAESKSALTQLRAAFQLSDFKAAAALCHKLTSAAANVGALEFAKQVRRLGQLCAAHDSAHTRDDLHERLQAAHPLLIEELLSVRLRESA